MAPTGRRTQAKQPAAAAVRGSNKEPQYLINPETLGMVLGFLTVMVGVGLVILGWYYFFSVPLLTVVRDGKFVSFGPQARCRVEPRWPAKHVHYDRKATSVQQCKAACERDSCLLFNWKQADNRCILLTTANLTEPMGSLVIDFAREIDVAQCYVSTEICINIPEASAASLGTSEETGRFRCMLSRNVVAPEGAYGATHLVLRDFLPAALAEELYADVMRLRFMGDADSEASAETADWLFATLDVERSSDGTDKLRSLRNITGRRTLMTDRLTRGKFAYAKWEAGRSEAAEAVQRRLRTVFASGDVRGRLARAAADDAGFAAMADNFLSLYARGDFLSVHDDGLSGDWAFVYGLTKGWSLENGGNLYVMRGKGSGSAFSGPAQMRRSLVDTVVPSFNSLVLMPIDRVDPDAVRTPHLVSPVRVNQRRVAFTGWYQSAAGSHEMRAHYE